MGCPGIGRHRTNAEGPKQSAKAFRSQGPRVARGKGNLELTGVSIQTQTDIGGDVEVRLDR